MGTVVNVTLGDDTRLNLVLGQQLENAVTSVVFDFSAWQTTYGSGTLALSVQRPGDDQPYAVTMTTSGTNATWSVTNLDTAYKGVGHIQLTYTVGSAIKKSVVYKFTVYESLGANGEYPSPGQTWQEEIEDELADVKQDLLALEQEGYPMASIQEAVDAWADAHESEIVNGYVTPEMYGAVGDGVSDDTAAVMNALESGRAVYAAKAYKVSSLKLDNVTLVGESQHTSLFHCANSIILGKNINVSNIGFLSDASKALLFPGNDTSIVSDGGNFLNHVIRDCKITCPAGGYNICYDLYSTFGACNVLWDAIEFHGASAINFGIVLNQTQTRIPWMTNVNVSHCTTLDTGVNSAAKMLEVKYVASGSYDRDPHLGNFNFIDNGFQAGDNFEYFAEIQYLHRGRFVNSIYDASGHTFHLLNNQNDITIQGWGGAASPTDAILCESGVELVRNVSFADNYLGYGISNLQYPEVSADYVGRWLTQPRVNALAVSTDSGAHKVTGIHVDSYRGFYTGAQYGEFQFGKDTSQRLVYRYVYSNGTWSNWMYVYNDNYVPHGTSAQRPASANTGAFYYDETLKKPLWFYASYWRDATGAIV